ncbi:MAG: hypothetical protein JW915_18125 [Chitinispirillaceae bacterium]|nr:hypothetical protein [Chitinispirillaceae bacterium]
MKIKNSQIFAIVIIALITSVPVIQAVFELSKKEPVQFLNVFSDTFITPFTGVSRTIKTFRSMQAQLDSVKEIISSDSYNVENDMEKISFHTEEARAFLEDIQRSMVSVNRYYTDSAAQTLEYLDSIDEQLNLLDVSLQNGEEIDTSMITRLVSSSKVAQKKAVRSGGCLLLLPVKHFFHYTFFNKKYLRGYEKDMENSSVVASSVRPLVQFARYSLLKDYGDKVVAGKNGWLFYKPDVEYLFRPSTDDPRSIVVDYNDKALTDDPLEIIIDFKNQLASMGIELLVVVVPGKPSIYPDLIGSIQDIEKYRMSSHSMKFMRGLRQRGVDVVDLFGPFSEERKNDQSLGDSLYLKRDTHWKPRGAVLAAKIVAAGIQKKSWFSDNKKTAEYVLDTVEVSRAGDIAEMTNLSDFQLGKLKIRFLPERTKCWQVYSVNRDDSGNVISKKLYKDDYRSSRILILGDSFSRIYQTDEPRGAGWIAHVAYQLGEPVASIVNDGGASTIVRQTLSRNKPLLRTMKLVIWEFVERDLRFGDMGWQRIDFTAEVKQ